MTVDTKSYQLAEYFLQDHQPVTAQQTMALAEAIQSTIEDWISFDLPQQWAYRCGDCRAYGTDPGVCPTCHRGTMARFAA